VISLDHLLIDEVVLNTRFACDVQHCKGACCTLPGGAGAPVRDEEVEDFKAAGAVARKYLTESSQQHLDAHGPLVGRKGEWATTCIDDKDCVFVVYNGDVATCAIEKAFHAGETDFRKPISCHLFPLRVADFGGPYVYYERFSECAPGRALGERTNTPLIVSARESIVRAFGEDFYNRLNESASEYHAEENA